MAYKNIQDARDYGKKWYEAHREKRILATKILRDKRMGIAQKEVVGYLRQHPCTDCGEKDIIVLDFDHVRGTKRQGISVMIRVGYKWEDILLEIDKCEVVCANCHRKRTAKRGNHFKYLASLVG